ncbi:MAG: pyridoxal-phosphate dependent enzyme [Proteobacteria bacterium]|nr:pyridoxal-phosphate dependent enzyme [Pseudomonadota bacterium]
MIPQHHYVSCVGCGTRVHAYDLETFSCPNRDCMPNVNHVLQKKHVITQQIWQRSKLEDSKNPFIRYRHRLLGYHRTINSNHSDIDYIEKVSRLDGALQAIDGTGFTETPLTIEPELADAIGFDPMQKLFVKNETHNVAGSHKARHLFGILLNLSEDALHRPFAIASCGNAALAAAVVSKAAGAKLEVFIPTDAEESVVERLKALGATLHICERHEGELGDPCYLCSLEAVKNGAIPFTCQGPDNGLTIEGGETLAYELFDQWRENNHACHHMFVQVGGGALASSSAQALAEVMRHEPLPTLPRFHTVQTRGAFPLARAYDRIVKVIDARLKGQEIPSFKPYEDDLSVGVRAAAHDVSAIEQRLIMADCIRSAWDSTAVQSAVRYAAANKPLFMWPWESAPHSIAHGILDDETYDWYAIICTMFRTGGIPLVADEDHLKAAHDLAHSHTDITPSATGSAGLAGLMLMKEANAIADYENACIYFTGIER